VLDIATELTVAVRTIGLLRTPEDEAELIVVAVALQAYSGSEFDSGSCMMDGSESENNRVPHGIEVSCECPAMPQRSMPGELVA